MQGFILADYAARFYEARASWRNWYEFDLLKQKTTVIDRFTELPNVLIKLFDGYNAGKMVVRNDKFRD